MSMYILTHILRVYELIVTTEPYVKPNYEGDSIGGSMRIQ